MPLSEKLKYTPSTSGGQYAETTTISEKIIKNLFIHGSKRNYLTTIPTIHKNYDLLPHSLKGLFLMAFETGSSKPSDRPNAEVWGQTIVEALKNSNITANNITIIPKQKNIIQDIPKAVQQKPISTNYPTNTNQSNANNQSSSNNGLGIVLFIIIIVAIGMGIMQSKKDVATYNNDSISVDSVSVDTTVAVDTAAVISTDTTSVISVTPDNGNLGENPATYSDENGYTPEYIAKVFLISLNNSDCETAWNATYNPKWERKGKEWFCSTKAYGGVSKVEIYEMKEVANYEDEVVIFVKYYAEDLYNGNGEYSQNFILNKIQKRWYITDVRNIEK